MSHVPPPEPPPIHLPRELVLASAGTGKTFTLSSRMMGLLAAGVTPGSILATTFTRKAAGEILTRVLARLAGITLGDPHELKLASSALLGSVEGGEETVLRARFARAFSTLVRELHRVNVGTLDSFFIRIAGSFPGELGLPPEWGICDEPMAQGMEAEALQAVLAAGDPAGMAELVRMVMRGESGRGVHRRVLSQLGELRNLLHQQGIPDPDTLWQPPAPLGPSEDGDGAEWPVILDALRNAPLPLTKAGTPHASFEKAVEAGTASLESGDWEGFCLKGLGKSVLEGKDRFSQKEIPPELLRAVRVALVGVARALAPGISRQSRALRSLVVAYDEALSRIQRREGAYRFQDITFLLGGVDPVATRSDLWYRLDQRTQHLLLDEFQDTSRAQWEALEPLAAELLSERSEERSVVVVADPKQSIYGWRGAEPELVRRVGARFELTPRDLTLSYRSSEAVLSLVNRIFTHLPENPVWEEEDDLRDVVTRWSAGFKHHRPALDLPGYVAFRAGPREEGATPSRRPSFMTWVAEWVENLHRTNPKRSLGILVRRNATVARLVRDLRALGVDASEEGSSSLADSPAVSTTLAALRLADHPDDSLAAYQVALSPLGEVVGLDDFQDPGKRRRVALDLRRALLTEGYGALLHRWARELGSRSALDKRDLGRALQLVELGHRWDEKATLRPVEFTHFVRRETMEAPSDSPVRVMTVHQAKGLEFDGVILPELDDRMAGGRGRHQAVVPLRDRETGQVLRVFPKLRKELLPLFPQMHRAGLQDREAKLQDAIGVLYVALTRARHALYLCTAADPPSHPVKLSFSHSGLIRYALELNREPTGEGDYLLEEGDALWGSRGVAKEEVPGAPVEAEARHREAALTLRLTPSGERSRNVPHRTPSSHPHTASVELGRILTLRGGAGRRVGAIIHRWLETMEWVEEWSPGAEALRAMALEVSPGVSPEESDALARRLREWLSNEEVRTHLSRNAHPPGARVHNELPFALRLDGTVVQGRMDRVVLDVAEGRVTRAWVIDFKTDAVPPEDEGALAGAVEEYREQLSLYARALERLFHLSPERVSAALLFLAPGRVVELASGRSR